MKRVIIRTVREVRVLKMAPIQASRMADTLEGLGWKEAAWIEDGKVVRLFWKGSEEVEIRG